MKNKMMPLMISGVLLSFSALSQTNAQSSHPKMDAYYHHQNTVAINIADTAKVHATNTLTGNVKPSGNFTYKLQPQQTVHTQPQEQPVYRDTRLGSSSKMYDTYEKNDYGAGAITTNPNK